MPARRPARPTRLAGTVVAAAVLALAAHVCLARGADAQSAGDQRLLPLLNAPEHGVDAARVEVKNASTRPAVAALIVWGAAGACEPAAAGPTAVLCSRPIAPDGEWTFYPAELPADAQSGIIFSLSGEAAATGRAPGERICAVLRSMVPGNQSAYRTFKLAYEHGPYYASVRAADFRGPELLAAVRHRLHNARGSGGGGYSAEGPGAAATDLVVTADRADGFPDLVHIQNAGTGCTDVSLIDPIAPPRWLLSLAAGETAAVDPFALRPDAGDTVTLTLRAGQPILARSWIGAETNRPPVPPVRPPVSVDPPPVPSPLTFLPVLDLHVRAVHCDPALQIENPAANTEAAMALVVGFGGPGPCPPWDAGPLTVTCTGLIRPGGTWYLPPGDWSAGAVSGLVFSLSTRRLSEIGVVFPADPDPDTLCVEDVAGERLCGLVRDMRGQPDDLRTFKQSYESGRRFQDIPMDAARGPGLAVSVARDCRIGDTTFAVNHAAVAAAQLTSAGTDGTYSGSVADLTAEAGGRTSLLFLQNAGGSCTEARLDFSDLTSCTVPAIAPGETFALDVAACAGTGQADLTATVTSREPLALRAETFDAAIDRPLLPSPPRPVDVAAEAATLVHLPILRYLPEHSSCDAVIEVTNPVTSTEAAIAVLAVHGECHGEWCEPHLDGPLLTFCSGLLRPGARWWFEPQVGGVPADQVRSGTLFSFNARPLAEAGLGSTRGDDLVGNMMCELLYFGTLGDADDFRRLKLSYLTGGQFAGLDMRRTVGPPLTAAVRRDCADRNWTFQAFHPGSTPLDLASPQPDGHYRTTLTDLVSVSGADRFTSYLYVQNAGVECTDVRIELDNGHQCYIHAIPSSATAVVDVAVCTGGEEAENLTATLISAQPLAVVEEGYGRDLDHGQVPDLPAPPVSPTPPAEPARLTHLPALRYHGNQPICVPLVQVDNPIESGDSAIAVLVAFGEAATCPPTAAGPHAVACSGLLRPGGRWVFEGPELAASSMSGVVYSFTGSRLSELGLSDALGFEDVAGLTMCETLFFALVGDPEDYRRLRLAYDAGSQFAGLPMRAVAGPALRVAVERGCRGAGLYTYAGVTPTAWSTRLEDGLYTSTLADVSAAASGGTSTLYVQNAGYGCTEVNVSFAPEAGGCTVAGLAPGEAVAIPAATCAAVGSPGLSATVTSSEPLAIVVDTSSEPPEADPLPTVPAELAPASPPTAARLTHLPILSQAAGAPVCAATVEARNPAASTETAIAILVLWGEENDCLAATAAPETVACSGLIRPGGRWLFQPEYGGVGAWAVSGVVYSLRTIRLSEIEVNDAIDDVVGHYLCMRLFTELGSRTPYTFYRRFKSAYEASAEFEQHGLVTIPMDRAAGPPLEVSVSRACDLPDGTMTSVAPGIDPARLSSRQADDTYHATVDGVVGDMNDTTSVLYLQNAGLERTTVSVTAVDSAGQVVARCPTGPISPGATATVNMAVCAGAPFEGSVTLESGQSLAVWHEVLPRELPEMAAVKHTWAEADARGRVHLGWRTGSEVGIAGFEWLRRASPADEPTVITAPPIPPRLGTATGTCYEHLDAPPAGRYDYSLRVRFTDDRALELAAHTVEVRRAFRYEIHLPVAVKGPIRE